jgi:hypothetical protein
VQVKTTDLKALILQKIETSEYNAFFRKDFKDLGGTYTQVGVILKELCQEERLRRIGHGIYGKTKVCTVEPFVGERILTRGLTRIAPEVLTRLGYQLSPSQAALDYNAGTSTQVPTGRNLRIQGKKTKRKIGYDNVYITYEYVN